MQVEATDLREALIDIVDLEEMFEFDDALAVLERQQEVVRSSDLNRFEFVRVDAQCREWKLEVCECQLAKRHRIGNAWKRVERGESVTEPGCLEQPFTIAQLFCELCAFVQAPPQLAVFLLHTLKIYCTKTILKYEQNKHFPQKACVLHRLVI